MRWVFGSLILAIMFTFPAAINSVDMTSENYKVFVDVISVGGDLATSTNYKVFYTSGEASGVQPTTSTSANYQAWAGFQAMAQGVSLSASFSTNAVSLGSLSITAVASVSQTITVTTDAPTGYTVTIAEDGNLRSGTNDINDVADGTVSAGSEEYGVRTSGAAGQMNNADTAITGVVQTVASTSTAASAEQTAVTYKAAASSDTQSGSYSQTVTFTTTVNY